MKGETVSCKNPIYLNYSGLLQHKGLCTPLFAEKSAINLKEPALYLCPHSHWWNHWWFPKQGIIQANNKWGFLISITPTSHQPCYVRICRTWRRENKAGWRKLPQWLIFPTWSNEWNIISIGQLCLIDSCLPTHSPCHLFILHWEEFLRANYGLVFNIWHMAPLIVACRGIAGSHFTGDLLHSEKTGERCQESKGLPGANGTQQQKVFAFFIPAVVAGEQHKIHKWNSPTNQYPDILCIYSLPLASSYHGIQGLDK